VVRCFKWAVENELVAPSVHLGLKAVAGLRKGRSGAKEGQPVRPVAEDQVEAIRPHVSRQVWAMVELQRVTGMRSGEVTAMTTGALDRSADVWIFTPPAHKTEHHDKPRPIYLGPRAQEILREWLKADPDASLFSPAEAIVEHRAGRRAARSTPLTPSQRARRPKRAPKRAPGSRYTPASYGQAIANACKRAGIPHWHPQRLRHGAATGIRREFGLDVARVLLGHSSPVTPEIYAEIDAQKAVEAVRKIG
jgi:integrase